MTVVKPIRFSAATLIPRLMNTAVLLLSLLFTALAAPARAEDGAPLRARYETLRARLEASDFKRPLYLESREGKQDLSGEIYAVIDEPYALVRPALQEAGSWCEILVLHMNVKYCRSAAAGSRLAVGIGRKYKQPDDHAYAIEFRFRPLLAGAAYLRVALEADAGPFGTHDYRIALEAVPLDAGRTFLHFSYAQGYGFAARLAMEAYLHTLGRDKVGFTVVARGRNGAPVYVDGVRGVVERNAMRYFLAVDAYLDSLRVPPSQRVEKRLQYWYAQTERYPAQLHELEADQYFAMKRRELARQGAM